MKYSNHEKRINPDNVQVFLFSCPALISLGIARHHWFVVNKKGNLSRWEVLIEQDCCGISWGHLHNNHENIFKGTGLVGLRFNIFPKVRCDGLIEGGYGSVADKMARFIEDSNNTYPYCYEYSIFGPNSNTYIKWVLDHFPEFLVRLPWNAIGRGHKFK